MSKREASQIAATAGVAVDAPRAKRRKEVSADSKQPGTSMGVDGVKKEGEGSEQKKEDPDVVKEKGLKLWHTVKDAVDKEGRQLSVDFMRLPSKRLYAGYYSLIKRPIALEDIKAQLDASAFTSFEDVKHDFETCFRNAKRFNIRESQIFQDAKVLHKLVKKEYAKMTGTAEEAVEDEGEDHVGGSDDEGSKKKKPPNMSRLLKTRLQKLVEKTDDSGRVLSTAFMELPNRKQWPIYYKTIKRPQCLENIFKRLKRKEYSASQDFANDVELVFSNALEFNQEHSEIWEDATVLRDYFRQIMSDLPPPHSIPAYAPTETHTRIRLRVPAAYHPSSSQTSPPTQQSTPSIGTLKIRPHHLTTNGTTPTPVPPSGESTHSPALATQQSPAATATESPPLHPTAQNSSQPVMPVPVPAVTQLKASVTPGHLQPALYPPSAYPSPYAQQYANSAYSSPVAPLQQATTPAPTQTPTIVPPVATITDTLSPSDTHKHRLLKSVSILTRPLGRRLQLDHTDGVRTWAVRLSGETAIRVTGVQFIKLDEEDEERSDEEEKAHKPEEEEEGEEEKEKEEPKPEKRKRGRPPKKKQQAVESAKTEATKKGKAPMKHAPEEVQLKLNGAPMDSVGDNKAEWDIELPIGPNLVEVGGKGGIPWRLYLDRLPV